VAPGAATEATVNGRGRGRLALVFTLLTAAPATTGPEGLSLSSCHLGGLAEEVRCGTLSVPENRATPSGRELRLAVATIPARSAAAEPDPLVLLAGGPGQAARDLAAWAQDVFARVRRNRDIVLLDLRGTGDSAPLDCAETLVWLDSDNPSAGRQAARACAERHREADLPSYGHHTSIDDLADVLEALGYTQVNLWGGSFGTRAALAFAARYPERVRSVLLDAPAPPELRFPLYAAQDADKVFARILDACRRAPDCEAAFPDVSGELARLVQRLAAEAIRVVERDPLTGVRRSFSIGRDEFVNTLRAALYTPRQRAVLPLVIARAARGEFGPYLALSDAVRGWSSDTMSLGATLSVVCSEDVVRILPAEIAPATAGTLLGRRFVDVWKAMCETWPVGPAPPELDTVERLPLPALILTGELDPVTPSRWGTVMARRFESARVLTLPGGGHTVSRLGCVPRLMAEFLERPDPGELDAACLSRWQPPAFVLGGVGR